MLKRENHELLSERTNLASVLQVLSGHEEAVAHATQELLSLEARARQVVQAEGFLSLDVLECLRQYMPHAHKQVHEAETSRARSEASAAQTNEVVTRHTARVRAIERVHGRIAAEHELELERNLARQMDELWLQRREPRS
jgi:hypothetical protein